MISAEKLAAVLLQHPKSRVMVCVNEFLVDLSGTMFLFHGDYETDSETSPIVLRLEEHGKSTGKRINPTTN